jgi:hypothetical protein
LAILSGPCPSLAPGSASGAVVAGHVRRSAGNRNTGTSVSASIAIVSEILLSPTVRS